MSPEQAEGRPDRVGPASDVYGLGATLYTILTGKAPVTTRDREELLRRVRSGDIAPPRQLRPDVHPALEAVCLKAMHVDPTRRYPSAAALAEEVDHWLAGEPVAAWPEPWTVRAQRWASRHRTAVTATAATLLVALVLLGGATILLTNAWSDTRRALSSKDEEARQKELARGDAQPGWDKAVKNEEEAVRQKLLAENRERLARATSYNTQLLRVGEVWGSDPSAALELLQDTKPCPWTCATRPGGCTAASVRPSEMSWTNTVNWCSASPSPRTARPSPRRAGIARFGSGTPPRGR